MEWAMGYGLKIVTEAPAERAHYRFIAKLEKMGPMTVADKNGMGLRVGSDSLHLGPKSEGPTIWKIMERGPPGLLRLG